MHSIQQERPLAIQTMVKEIGSILADCTPSIYLYGSCVLDDFQLGWSDIDILVLTEKQMTATQAEQLVCLRQTLLENEPANPYYRSFEGGMLTLNALLSHKADRVVYWGTSGESITDHYLLDPFGMAQLIENGILLYGKEIRQALKTPAFHELYTAVERHYETIRTHAQKTGRSFYSFGWMLDIARCLYTLRTGRIIAKTQAAQWALNNSLCQDPDVLAYALKVRQNPLHSKSNPQAFAYAETLGEPIQRFADVLENELKKTKETAQR